MLNHTKKEYIPQFDHIFNEEQVDDKKKKKFNFILKVIVNNKLTVFLSTILAIIQILPTVIVPLATSDIINVVTEIVATGYRNEFTLKLILAITLSALSIILNEPSTALRYRITCKMERNIIASLRMSVVKKLQCMSITYHKELQTGEVDAKFLNSISSIENYLHNINFAIIPVIISCTLSIIISIVKNGYVSLFFLFVIPINILLMQFFRKKIAKENRDYRKDNERMGVTFNTMLEMMPVTKAHGLENTEVEHMSSTISQVALSGYKLDKTNGRFGSGLYVVSNLMSLLCLVFCSFMAIQKYIQVGDVVLYQSMFTLISGYITSIINQIPTILAGKEGLNAISEVMSVNEVEKIVSKPNNMQIEGDIDFENVSYAYPRTNVDVIKDFNLNIKAGECVAFVGSSGSGKTTIMNMIIGFLPANSGVIKIDGQDIKEINLADYRHNLSVVPQNSILFAGTIKENITYGLDKYTDEDIKRVCTMANLDEMLLEMPKGLDTIIGEKGDKLSGGQKQRITIARALIRNPKILILDEATSALDNVSEYNVQKAIEQSIKGRTTLIVAHRLSTIRNADKIVVMENGRIVETGTYQELMEKKGKFFNLKSLNDATSKLAESELNK